MADGNGAPETTSGNPFDLIAYLLFKVRHSLEDVQELDRPPRWVRVSRARTAQADSDFIGRGVKTAVNGFAEGLSYLVELALDVQEVLIQTDAAKAILEVTADLITAATDDKFVDGIRTLLGESPGGQNPVSGVGAAVEDIKRYLGYIPDPDDVLTVGHQLFRLLGVVQEEFPLSGDAVDGSQLNEDTASHIVIDQTGKVRLMQWAFGEGTTTFGLGSAVNPEEESVDLFRFGSRRLWKAAQDDFPTHTLVQWGQNGTPEELVSFYFDAREAEPSKQVLDLTEAHSLLEKMGYKVDGWDTAKFDDDLELAIKKFQYINGIATSGRLDNPTINRLMNFNFGAKNILRAKPYAPELLPPDDELVQRKAGVFSLANPGADGYADEGISVNTSKGAYGYYECGALLPASGGATLPKGVGWIVEQGSDNDAQPNGEIGRRVPRFVGMQSRRPADPKMPDRQLDGGKWSEGEAATGEYFFAARHVEPWIAGRTGAPTDPIFPGQPTPGALSRMYQWVPLAEMIGQAGPKELYLTATVMQRSLYEDRSATTHLPDQGRIAIEFYPASVYDDEGTGSRRSFSDVLSRHQSEWYPQHVMPLEDIAPTEVARKRKWALRRVGPIKVPVDHDPAPVAVCVVLEGRHQSAFDIDAYFDDVRLSWEIRPAQA